MTLPYVLHSMQSDTFLTDFYAEGVGFTTPSIIKRGRSDFFIQSFAGVVTNGVDTIANILRTQYYTAVFHRTTQWEDYDALIETSYSDQPISALSHRSTYSIYDLLRQRSGDHLVLVQLIVQAHLVNLTNATVAINVGRDKFGNPVVLTVNPSMSDGHSAIRPEFRDDWGFAHHAQDVVIRTPVMAHVPARPYIGIPVVDAREWEPKTLINADTRIPEQRDGVVYIVCPTVMKSNPDRTDLVFAMQTPNKVGQVLASFDPESLEA